MCAKSNVQVGPCVVHLWGSAEHVGSIAQPTSTKFKLPARSPKGHALGLDFRVTVELTGG